MRRSRTAGALVPGSLLALVFVVGSLAGCNSTSAVEKTETGVGRSGCTHLDLSLNERRQQAMVTVRYYAYQAAGRLPDGSTPELLCLVPLDDAVEFLIKDSLENALARSRRRRAIALLAGYGFAASTEADAAWRTLVADENSIGQIEGELAADGGATPEARESKVYSMLGTLPVGTKPLHAELHRLLPRWVEEATHELIAALSRASSSTDAAAQGAMATAAPAATPPAVPHAAPSPALGPTTGGATGVQPTTMLLTIPHCGPKAQAFEVTPPKAQTVEVTVTITVEKTTDEVRKRLDPQSWDKCNPFFCPPPRTYLVTEGWTGTKASCADLPSISDPPAGTPIGLGGFFTPRRLFEHASCKACKSEFKNVMQVQAVPGTNLCQKLLPGECPNGVVYEACYSLDTALAACAAGLSPTLSIDQGRLSACPLSTQDTEVRATKKIAFQQNYGTGGAFLGLYLGQAEAVNALTEQVCCSGPGTCP